MYEEFQQLGISEWSTLTISLRWVYEGAVPETGVGDTGSPDLTVWRLYDGRAEVDYGDGRVARPVAGQWVVLPPGHRRQSFEGVSSLSSICSTCRWPDGRPLLQTGLPVCLDATEGEPLSPLLECLRVFSHTHLNEQNVSQWWWSSVAKVDVTTYLEGERLLMEWLQTLLTLLGKQGVVPEVHRLVDERVMRALDLIESLSFENLPSMAEIASRVGLSDSRLQRLMRETLGKTPKRVVQERRMREARELLEKSAIPIKEIAYRLGFRSANAFNNWCWKHLDARPGDIRAGQASGIPSAGG